MAGSAPGDAPLVPGARVAIGKDRDKATVRYVGPVAGQAGLWVGVEWDDPSRGKHDGSTGGAKYFDVAGGPTAGSFVRSEKVAPGAPLLAALRARYNNEAAEGAPGAAAACDRAVYVPSASGARRVLVELVGEEEVTRRQRRTELLERARVVGAGVAGVVRRAAARLAPRGARLARRAAPRTGGRASAPPPRARLRPRRRTPPTRWPRRCPRCASWT